MFETTNQSIFMIYITIFGYNDPIPKLVMYRSNMVDLSISAGQGAGPHPKFLERWLESQRRLEKRQIWENMGNIWETMEKHGKYGKHLEHIG